MIFFYFDYIIRIKRTLSKKKKYFKMLPIHKKIYTIFLCVFTEFFFKSTGYWLLKSQLMLVGFRCRWSDPESRNEHIHGSDEKDPDDG